MKINISSLKIGAVVVLICISLALNVSGDEDLGFKIVGHLVDINEGCDPSDACWLESELTPVDVCSGTFSCGFTVNLQYYNYRRIVRCMTEDIPNNIHPFMGENLGQRIVLVMVDNCSDKNIFTSLEFNDCAGEEPPECAASLILFPDTFISRGNLFWYTETETVYKCSAPKYDQVSTNSTSVVDICNPLFDASEGSCYDDGYQSWVVYYVGSESNVEFPFNGNLNNPSRATYVHTTPVLVMILSGVVFGIQFL